MTHKTTTAPGHADLLREAQNYRTSLESLMEVGRSMLSNPSMEDGTATAFQVLAENVLEEANHQGDLAVIDGVEEPEARVELIMQDVLTPRLTEVEQIEESLMAKADADEPVPFTTRDSETSVSQESAYSLEVLSLFRENIGTVKAVLSMEGLNADLARPMVLQVAGRVVGNLESLGISMESLEQTQVLGDMSEAVDRIEALVSKAHEAVTEQAEGVRSEAESLGADNGDPMGDLIEKHRTDNPSGVKFDDDTAVNTIESDAPTSSAEEGTELDAEAGETTDDDLDQNGVPDDADLDNGALADTDASTVTDEAEAAQAEADLELVDDEAEQADAEAEEQEEESEEKDDEEEEEDDTVSTESNVEPLVFESVADREGEEAQQVKDILYVLLNWMADHDQLSSAGAQMIQEMNQGIPDSFVLSSELFTPKAADVMARHYHTWMAASLRDQDANLRSMSVLLGL